MLDAKSVAPVHDSYSLDFFVWPFYFFAASDVATAVVTAAVDAAIAEANIMYCCFCCC